MKKRFNLFLALLLISLLIFQVSALTIKSPKQTLKDIESQYLKKAWTDFISNNKFFGPAHNFLIAYPLLTKIPFGTAYEFTPLFFLIVILWILASFQIYKWIKALKISFLNPLLAPIFAIILAQIGLYKTLSGVALDFMFSSSSWWARGIVIFAIFMILLLENLFNTILLKMYKSKREANKKTEEEQNQKILKTTVKEMQEITKLNNDNEKALSFMKKDKGKSFFDKYSKK